MRVMQLVAVAAFSVTLTVACGGGSRQDSDSINQPQLQADTFRESLELELSEQAGKDGMHHILLHGLGARDLYQVAATLEYDPGLYEIVLVEAGGGLGDPGNSYFIDSIREPGKLDFAYTKRWAGKGTDGDPLLLSVKVRPLGAFNLADFSISTDRKKIRIRDSKKQDMLFRLDGREAGNE